jgi:hypothetical protein
MTEERRWLTRHDWQLLEQLNSSGSLGVTQKWGPTRLIRRLEREGLLTIRYDVTCFTMRLTEAGRQRLQERREAIQRLKESHVLVGSARLRSNIDETDVLVGLDWVTERVPGFDRQQRPTEPLGFLRGASKLQGFLETYLAWRVVMLPDHPLRRRWWNSQAGREEWAATRHQELRCFDLEGLTALVKFVGLNPRRHVKRARKQWTHLP